MSNDEHDTRRRDNRKAELRNGSDQSTHKTDASLERFPHRHRMATASFLIHNRVQTNGRAITCYIRIAHERRAVIITTFFHRVISFGLFRQPTLITQTAITHAADLDKCCICIAGQAERPHIEYL
ncbi:hypothetical protein Tcan_14860 [Toxocara canis]|uniref:Uncharacterized protein n=1 Tax=Toxocara canis TaxID=6265 RepID=A0A0B2VKH3_TOXCA|nr:hypothetical protein Tcan_14860 [Toxocara canis]